MTQEVIAKLQEIMTVLAHERGNLKVLLKTVVLEARTHVTSATILKGYLVEAPSSTKKLE